MRQHSSYLMSQIAQDFEFRARLGQWSVHPEAITRQILTWTDGQPFLTYRLYELVLESLQQQHASPNDSFLPVASSDLATADVLDQSTPDSTDVPDIYETNGENGSAYHQAAWVDGLIQARCIERCMDPELLRHLRRICKSILEDRRSLQLLEIYQAVLNSDSVPSHHLTSLERRLIQTGLIKQKGPRLVLSNRLYQSIFNQAWLERAFRTARSRKPISAHQLQSSKAKGLPTLSIHRPNPLESNYQSSASQASHSLPAPSSLSSVVMTASFPTDSSPPTSSQTDLIPGSDSGSQQSRPRSISSLSHSRSAILLGLALVTCTLGALAIALMSYGDNEAQPEQQSLDSHSPSLIPSNWTISNVGLARSGVDAG